MKKLVVGNAAQCISDATRMVRAKIVIRFQNSLTDLLVSVYDVQTKQTTVTFQNSSFGMHSTRIVVQIHLSSQMCVEACAGHC